MYLFIFAMKGFSDPCPTSLGFCIPLVWAYWKHLGGPASESHFPIFWGSIMSLVEIDPWEYEAWEIQPWYYFFRAGNLSCESSLVVKWYRRRSQTVEQSAKEYILAHLSYKILTTTVQWETLARFLIGIHVDHQSKTHQMYSIYHSVLGKRSWALKHNSRFWPT